MCVPVLLCVYATNATMVRSKAAVLSAEGLGSLMLTSAKSVRSRRKTGMVAPKIVNRKKCGFKKRWCVWWYGCFPICTIICLLELFRCFLFAMITCVKNKCYNCLCSFIWQVCNLAWPTYETLFDILYTHPGGLQFLSILFISILRMWLSLATLKPHQTIWDDHASLLEKNVAY